MLLIFACFMFILVVGFMFCFHLLLFDESQHACASRTFGWHGGLCTVNRGSHVFSMPALLSCIDCPNAVMTLSSNCIWSHLDEGHDEHVLYYCHFLFCFCSCDAYVLIARKMRFFSSRFAGRISPLPCTHGMTISRFMTLELVLSHMNITMPIMNTTWEPRRRGGFSTWFALTTGWTWWRCARALWTRSPS